MVCQLMKATASEVATPAKIISAIAPSKVMPVWLTFRTGMCPTAMPQYMIQKITRTIQLRSTFN